MLGHSTLGTSESVREITIDDLRSFYDRNYSPSVSFIAVAGDISQADAVDLFRPLEESWQAKDVAFPEYPQPSVAQRPRIYFVDMPGARQSQIYVGHLGLSRTHEDYYAATVMNYKLGGSFNGALNLILREEKGYTYGARSGFRGGHYPGLFLASSSVMSNATLESVEIFRDEITNYREGVSEEDLNFTKNALIQSNALEFETLSALQGMLNQIGTYELPFDYVRQEESITREMTLDQHRELAQRYIQPDQMVYVIVGDAGTQLPRLRQLGLGNPVQLDAAGNRVR
jgi:zinc protease